MLALTFNAIFVLCLFVIDVAVSDEKEPLFLSQYIKNGTADVGRRLSEVNSSYMLNVESYAGYITVNEEYNSNTFFWYFPVERGHVENDPLVIWLQGGPLLSSIISLFEENGPFYYKEGVLIENPFSWHKNQSMLFIDNPIGAGFSFTDDTRGYATEQSQISKNLYDFLVQFLKIFPELQSVPLFLTGQSYAGKHIPSFAYEIHNRNPSADLKINLKGMAIGNAWLDPSNTYQVSEFLYQLGVIDFNMAEKAKTMEYSIEYEIAQEHWKNASKVYLDLIMYLTNEGRLQSIYNYITDKPCYTNSSFIDFIDQTEIREALHVGERTFHYYNNHARGYLDDDVMKGMKHILEKLLEEYPVMLYNGQLDTIVPYVNSQKIYRSMNWTRSEEYKKASRDPWNYDGKLAGYLKVAGNFEEILIRNAGHCVAVEKPELLMKLITAFTHDKSDPIKANLIDPEN